MEISATGAVIGLLLAVVLIIRKVPACYALMIGAFAGGIAGGAGPEACVKEMISGAKDIMPAVLRVLAAGILAGTLICSGAAERIAQGIIEGLGHKRAVLALILSALALTAAGVFIDVAVLTVAPVALAVAYRGGYSRMGILFALIGGGKSGNVISANPNTIIAAENYHAPLSNVMLANVGAALVGVAVTLLIARWLVTRGEGVEAPATAEKAESLPALWAAVAGPAIAVFLLFLRPVAGIAIDPLVALPVGGIAGAVLMGRWRKCVDYAVYGLKPMSNVSVLLIGTGALAGIIKASTLKTVILDGMNRMGLPDLLIAPVSGALMSGATASTTAGATIASATFGQVVLAAGISAVWGAAMTNAGATVLDHLPHGSFFHVTGGSVSMSFKGRLKLIPYESLVGGALAAVSTLSCWLFMRFFA